MRPSTSPAGGLRSIEESVPMALLRAREATMRFFRPLLAEHDLTEQQWRVLRVLAASDHRPTISDIAERSMLLAPSLTRIVANLEGRGLVERRADHGDLRKSKIALTRKGRNLVARIAPQSEQRYADLEAQIGADRLEELLTLLHEVSAITPSGSINEERP